MQIRDALAPATPLLQVRGLVKHFSRRSFSQRGIATIRAVDGVDIHLAPRETLGIVGESGCGKTTLGRLILGLLQPDEGRILLDGVDVTYLRGRARRPVTRRLQAVFQDPASSLNPRLRIGQSISEPLRAHGWRSSGKIRDRVAELLSRVGLNQEMALRWPHEFSGGQKQRVGIARAIALEPDVIVADEPTSALDVSIRAQIMRVLAELQSVLGTSFILVSHDLAVVRHYSQRVAVMYAGRIVEEGPTKAVVGSPLHPYSRRLVASVPSLDPSHRGRDARWEGGSLDVLPRAGCTYAPRCALAEARCRDAVPSLSPAASNPERRIACHVIADQSS